VIEYGVKTREKLGYSLSKKLMLHFSSLLIFYFRKVILHTPPLIKNYSVRYAELAYLIFNEIG